MTSLRLIITIALTIMLTACVGAGSYNGKSLAAIGNPSPLLANSTEPLQVLVIGGTSGVGLEVVKLSLARGHKVTAVARRPERMTINHPALRTVKGDITKVESMYETLPGNQIVISAVGIAAGSRNVKVFSKGIKNVLLAMQQSSIDRLITVSAIGVGESEGHGGFFFDSLLKPLVLNSDIEDKGRQEKLVKNSKANWTIVRPGFLTDKSLSEGYYVIDKLEGVEAGEISRSDVAHFIVACFEDNLYHRQTVLLSN
jgi:putative NADH-flavin reductase